MACSAGEAQWNDVTNREMSREHGRGAAEEYEIQSRMVGVFMGSCSPSCERIGQVLTVSQDYGAPPFSLKPTANRGLSDHSPSSSGCNVAPKTFSGIWVETRPLLHQYCAAVSASMMTLDDCGFASDLTGGALLEQCNSGPVVDAARRQARRAPCRQCRRYRERYAYDARHPVRSCIASGR